MCSIHSFTVLYAIVRFVTFMHCFYLNKKKLVFHCITLADTRLIKSDIPVLIFPPYIILLSYINEAKLKQSNTPPA